MFALMQSHLLLKVFYLCVRVVQGSANSIFFLMVPLSLSYLQVPNLIIQFDYLFSPLGDPFLDLVLFNGTGCRQSSIAVRSPILNSYNDQTSSVHQELICWNL